jgi:hypothetical protein
MVSQSVGHLAQTMIMSAPLFLIVLDRLLVVQSSTPWRDGLLLGLLASAQLLTGEEVLAMEAVTAAIAVIVLGAIARKEIARHLAYARTGSLIAAGVFGALSLPFLAFQYFGPDKVQDVHPPNTYVSDLLNFFVPTSDTKLAPSAALDISRHFTGNGSEQGAYIGIPLAIFIVFALFLARHRPVTWVAAAVAAGAGLLSMGPTVHFDGNVSPLYLPDDVLQHLPLFHNLLPDRFASMMTLGVALLVALGLGELKRLAPRARYAGWAIVAVGLVMLFPITDYPAAASPHYTAFDTGFSCPGKALAGGPAAGSAARELASPAAGPAAGTAAGTSGGNADHPTVALVMPTVNEMNLRWQTETNFCFAMPSDTGMTGTNSAYRTNPGVLFAIGDPAQAMALPSPAARQEAAREIAELDIKEIIVDPESPTVPQWSPEGQAQAVVWVEWLLGQAPLQSHDDYISYIWKDLPPVADIASGHVGYVKGEA